MDERSNRRKILAVSKQLKQLRKESLLTLRTNCEDLSPVQKVTYSTCGSVRPVTVYFPFPEDVRYRKYYTLLSE